MEAAVLEASRGHGGRSPVWACVCQVETAEKSVSPVPLSLQSLSTAATRSAVVSVGTLLPEEGWRGREIFGLAKEESRVKGLGNGYF